MTKKLTGTEPYQTPLNADLGTMAYQDADSVRVGSLISDGSVEIGINRTSSTSGIVLQLSDNVTGAQTDGVYKAIRSASNAGNSISEIRFLETDGTNNNTSISFATASTAGGLTERLRINQVGNVGIGTVAPEKQLHITTITNNGGSITGGADRQGSVIRLQHTINHEVGYTGGDFLGGLEFFSGDGSAGTGVRTAIRTSADDPYNTHSLRFYTASSNSTTLNETMRINHRGWVTMPYQPCFSARANGGTNPGANQTLPFPVVDVNTGSHYNTSTSTFTAPIDGTYFFYFQALGDAATNARAIAYIQKNGAYTLEGSATTKDYNSVQAQLIVSLSAGDTIRIQTDPGTEGTRFYGSSNTQNWFMGYLIG